MVSRFRSAWLSQNLALLVLRLLRESTLTEWDILSRLHSRYGLGPSAHEFERLEKELIRGGYATLEASAGGSRLHITTTGLGLLVKLEDEYHIIVGDVTRPHGTRAANSG